MEHLKEKLTGLVRELEKEKHDQVMQRLDDLVSFYPFNEYEFLISSLMGYGKITIDDRKAHNPAVHSDAASEEAGLIPAFRSNNR